MPEEIKKRRAALAPMLIGWLIFGAALYCVWLLWQQCSERAAFAEEAQARLASLTDEKKWLEGLIGKEPCEARDALRIRKPPAPVKPQAVAPEQPMSAAQTPVAAESDDVEAACVFLVSGDGKGHIVTGSGFFVAPGYILTNRHVVEKSNGKVLVTSKALGQPAMGGIAALSNAPGLDCALVKITPPPGSSAAILKFAPAVKKTEKVGAWGFPDLVGKNDPAYAKLLRGEDISAKPEPSYTEGVVSAILDRKPALLVHTAPISPGNSGGPLVNAKGQVTGINTQITLDEDSYRQASIAIAADDLKNFLSSHGLTPLTD